MSNNQIKYLTEEQLNEKIEVVVIRVFGSYSKRSEGHREVYEAQYEADLRVPKGYNVGDVKLAAQRYVKNELKGIRVRTFHVDKKVKQTKSDEGGRRRDFMSAQGIADNESLKRDHDALMAQRRARREAEMDPNYVPPSFMDDSAYGSDGLPPLVQGPLV